MKAAWYHQGYLHTPKLPNCVHCTCHCTLYSVHCTTYGGKHYLENASKIPLWNWAIVQRTVYSQLKWRPVDFGDKLRKWMGGGSVAILKNVRKCSE